MQSGHARHIDAVNVDADRVPAQHPHDHLPVALLKNHLGSVQYGMMINYNAVCNAYSLIN